ncbi:MAG: hypothetical protein NT031_17425 [Planctomycetota bacterium]|nr:hypothetical protein [Planctomycetota bacterium]
MGRFIKWMSVAAIMLAVRGCQRPEPLSPPVMFLGLPEDQEEKIGQKAPESALAGLTQVTAVETVGYDEYLRRAKAGDIKHEETHGRWVYWAADEHRCVPMSGGADAIYTLTHRYKSAIPPGTSRPASS